jgi:hypothetical protein
MIKRNGYGIGKDVLGLFCEKPELIYDFIYFIILFKKQFYFN